MSSDLVKRLRAYRESATLLEGEYNELSAIIKSIEALEGEVTGLQNTFDLMWKADMRAIKLWQEATGKDHIWPDRMKTTLWLLERAEAAEARAERLREALQVMLEPQGHVEMARAQARKALEDDKQ